MRESSIAGDVEAAKGAAAKALADAGLGHVEAHFGERLSSDPEGVGPHLIIEELAVGGIRPDGEQVRWGLSLRPREIGAPRMGWDDGAVYARLHKAATAHMAEFKGVEQAP